MRARKLVLGLASPLVAAAILGGSCATASATDMAQIATDQRVEVTKTYYVSAWQTTSPQDLPCPESHPYLINEQLAPGRAVPYGVRIADRIEFGNWPSSWVSTIALSQEREFSGVKYAAGIKGLVMTNWNAVTSFGIDVTLVCTASTSEAARV